MARFLSSKMQHINILSSIMNNQNQNDYNFNWSQLGNIELGRPHLGDTTQVAIYRLMQYTMRAVLEKEYGAHQQRHLFVLAGKLAGTEFCKNVLDASLGFNQFMADLQKKLIELKIGILKIEEANMERLAFIVTVSEDLDCSGLPITGETVCDYDEGFIEGIFETYTGKKFQVKEIDCWSTGDRTCRFTITAC